MKLASRFEFMLLMLFLVVAGNAQEAISLHFSQYIKALQSNDSTTAVNSYHQFTTTTQNQDSLELSRILLKSIYPKPEDNIKLNDFSSEVSVHTLELLYSSAGKFMAKPDIYVKVIDWGLNEARVKQLSKLWFQFFTAKASYAMMKRDESQLIEAIASMDGYDFESDSVNLASLLYFKATHRKITNDSTASGYYTQCIRILTRHLTSQADSSFMAATCTDYGSHLTNYGQLKEAIQYFIMGLEYLPEVEQFNHTKVGVLSRIARAYFRLENLEKSEEYIYEGFDICETSNFTSTKVRELFPISGDIAAKVGKYQQAIEYYSEVYAYAKKSKRRFLEDEMCKRIAICFLETEDIDRAQQWYGMVNNKEDQHDFLSLTYLCRRAVVRGNFDRAIIFAKQADELATNSGLPFLSVSSKELMYLTHKRAGDYATALQMHEAYQDHRDKLYHKGQATEIEELQTKYQVSLQAEKISSLKALNEVGNRVRSGQRAVIFGALIALLLLSWLLFQLRNLNERLKQKNAAISLANEEKETLLKEIHHRVKNNLQVISSLLKLQSRYIKDDNAIKAIADGRTRVQSMALLHQSLYKEENLKGVEMKSYFENLVQSLFDTYNIEEDKIDLTLDVDDLVLDIDSVIPIGLITNELVSNALKHAFVGRENGEISVKLKEIDGTLVLQVKDNGVGMLLDKKDRSNSFGEMLIDSLCHKLEAQLSRKVAEGSLVEITVKDYIKLAG